jgi:hypothetical protein
VAHFCAGCGKERFGAGVALHRINLWCMHRVIMRGQALDLLDVEHGVAAHERNLPVVLFAGLGVRLVARDLGHVNHLRAMLALAHMRAKLLRLVEGHPDRAGIPSDDSGRPKLDNVDALVGNSVGPQRSRDPACGVLDVPGREPGSDSLLQITNNAVGDPLINIGSHSFLPYLGGCGMQPSGGALKSGGRPSQAGKRCGVWCGPERSDYTARRFPPEGLP